MWVSTRVEDKLETFGEQWGEEEAYSQALMEVVAEDEGRTWAAGRLIPFEELGHQANRILQAIFASVTTS